MQGNATTPCIVDDVYAYNWIKRNPEMIDDCPFSSIQLLQYNKHGIFDVLYSNAQAVDKLSINSN